MNRSTLRAQRAHTLAEPVLGLREGGVAGAVGEVYDDAPFYHSLLRSLLEEGGAALAAAAAPKLKRTKRKAESRQSKGRRLSYEVQPRDGRETAERPPTDGQQMGERPPRDPRHALCSPLLASAQPSPPLSPTSPPPLASPPQVQPPLQNFMFPVVPERPVILGELFSSVFGRRPPSAPEEEGGDSAALDPGATRRQGAKRQRGGAGGTAADASVAIRHGVAAAEEEFEGANLFLR